MIVLLFLFDLFAGGERARRRFSAVACGLLLVQLLVNILPHGEGERSAACSVTSRCTASSRASLRSARCWSASRRTAGCRRDDTRHKQGEFYLLTLSTLLGMFFMIGAGNFLMFFLGLELASVPTACLVAFDKYRGHSAEAGAKYILCALFASGLMLYGISLLYGAVGTLYFDDVAQRLSGSPLEVMALVFFFAGLAFKISLVPFHLWTADTYEGRSDGRDGLPLGHFERCGGVRAADRAGEGFRPDDRRVADDALRRDGAEHHGGEPFRHPAEEPQAVPGLLVDLAGRIHHALRDRGQRLRHDLARVLRLVYLAANLTAFGVIASVEQHSGRVGLEDYNGFYRTNPRLTLAMTLALFSLAGIPPFAGFFSKFFVFAAAFRGGFHLLVFIALVNTVVSLYYYLLVVKAMYITPSDAPIAAFRSDRGTRISLVCCLAGVLLLGVVSAVYDGINLYAYGL